MLDQLAVPLDYTHAGSNHSSGKHFSTLQLPGKDFFKRKILFLHRDPLDLLVSGYFQATKRRKSFTGDIHSFVRHPGHGIDKILAFHALWRPVAQNRENILCLSYEDLKSDTLGSVAAVCDFFGRPRNAENLQRAVNDASFENMQHREAQGGFPDAYGGRLKPRDASDADSFKVRRGLVGGWRDYLSGDDLDFCAERAAHFGVELDYSAGSTLASTKPSG
jgi:hypothetical protein